MVNEDYKSFTSLLTPCPTRAYSFKVELSTISKWNIKKTVLTKKNTKTKNERKRGRWKGEDVKKEREREEKRFCVWAFIDMFNFCSLFFFAILELSRLALKIFTMVSRETASKKIDVSTSILLKRVRDDNTTDVDP